MPETIFRPGRRSLLAGAAGALTLPYIRPAFAAEEMVVGTWGGDYANLLRANVEDPILKPAGVNVVQDLADEDPRVAKLYAQRRLPRGTMDIACLQGVRGHEVSASGLTSPVEAGKVPSMSHVLPNLQSDTFIPHIYSPQIFIYNPEKVSEPPKTFTDLLDPKYKGRVGLGNGNYFYVMMAAALAATGDMNKVDAEPTRELMLKLNANGLRLYPSTDSIGAGIKSGEIDVGIMWLARVIMWQNAGIPVKASFPQEGNILYVAGMVVPKNAPRKEVAYKYLDAMLQPSAQAQFAEKMGYLPTVDNCPLTGRVAEQLALPEGVRMLAPDYSILGRLQTPTSEWWKKSVAGG